MESFRSVLEVCKFLSPFDILRCVGHVSYVFRRAGDCDELWTHFILIENPKFAFPSGIQSCKSLYIREFLKEFVHVTATQLTVFLLPVYRCTIRSLDKPLLIDESFVYSRLSDGRVLVCAGLSNLSYLIDASTAYVTGTPLMLVERKYPGLISIEHFAYAFGGFRESTELKRVEKFNLSEGLWKDAPKTIFSHSKFNPCRHTSNIYLFGSSGNEVFRVKSEVYTPLTLTLPLKSSGNIAIAFEQIIIVVSGAKKYRVMLGREMQVTDLGNVNKAFSCTSTTPLAIGLDAYFFVGGYLWKIEGDTMRVSKRSKRLP